MADWKENCVSVETNEYKTDVHSFTECLTRKVSKLREMPL